MKKLTKRQRNSIYKACLRRLEEHDAGDNGLCLELTLSCGDLGITKFDNDNSYYPMIHELPEFKAFAPHGSLDGYWFRDKKERIKALKKCIKQTNPQIT